MDIYQLDYILHEPEESEGWMYLAEVPTPQGCMAWEIPVKDEGKVGHAGGPIVGLRLWETVLPAPRRVAQ